MYDWMKPGRKRCSLFYREARIQHAMESIEEFTGRGNGESILVHAGTNIEYMGVGPTQVIVEGKTSEGCVWWKESNGLIVLGI